MATSQSALLRGSGSTNFQAMWPKMQPVVVKLLKQLSITRAEWQDLFWDVHTVCSWDEKAPAKIQKALEQEILEFTKEVQERVLQHKEESALLQAYIAEWRKFFEQCGYLPLPFQSIEVKNSAGKVQKKRQEGNKVHVLMLQTWNKSIFAGVRNQLLSAAMTFLLKERSGEDFDPQLVVGVRESFVNLCSDYTNKLQIYLEYFEKAYLDSTREFYTASGQQCLAENGVQNYMRYAYSKINEEQRRAERYLETSKESQSVKLVLSELDKILISAHREVIIEECPKLISNYYPTFVASYAISQ